MADPANGANCRQVQPARSRLTLQCRIDRPRLLHLSSREYCGNTARNLLGTWERSQVWARRTFPRPARRGHPSVTDAHSISGRMTHDSEENSLRAGEGTTIAAHNSSRPGGASATGFPVSRSERQDEASENIGHHLHLGPREGAGLDSQLTKRFAGQLKAHIPLLPETASCSPTRPACGRLSVHEREQEGRTNGRTRQGDVSSLFFP
jgi:hypothetical protein